MVRPRERIPPAPTGRGEGSPAGGPGHLCANPSERSALPPLPAPTAGPGLAAPRPDSRRDCGRAERIGKVHGAVQAEPWGWGGVGVGGWPGSSVVSAVTKVGRESPRRVRRPGAGRAVPPGGCTPDPAPPPPGRRRARPRCLPGCGRPGLPGWVCGSPRALAAGPGRAAECQRRLPARPGPPRPARHSPALRRGLCVCGSASRKPSRFCFLSSDRVPLSSPTRAFGGADALGGRSQHLFI